MEDQDKQPGWPLAEQALSHPERAEMLKRITRRGANATELAEALGLTRAKTKYHLLVLCRAGLVEEVDEPDGQHVAILNM